MACLVPFCTPGFRNVRTPGTVKEQKAGEKIGKEGKQPGKKKKKSDLQ